MPSKANDTDAGRPAITLEADHPLSTLDLGAFERPRLRSDRGQTTMRSVMLVAALLTASLAVGSPADPPEGQLVSSSTISEGSPEDELTKLLLYDGESNYRPVVHYVIDVQLDPESHELVATATISWKNTGSVPVTELWWHLYLNAFRNEDSTFIRESGGQLRGDQLTKDEWGWTDVTEIRARDLADTSTHTIVRHDLMPAAHFTSPDDGNDDDRTVWVTPLPFSVGPGQMVEIQLRWKARLPRVFARTGYGGTFHMVAQWFPKLGVLEESFKGLRQDFAGEPEWNCHQFHAFSEFFADYGSYRVRITVPSDMVVGATGQQVTDPVERDGKTTYEFYQERIHDFAWTADTRFLVRRFTFDPSDIPREEVAEAAEVLGLSPDQLVLTPVEVTMLLQPEHAVYGSRYRDSVEQGLKWFGLWFGRYPYATLTLVDGPRGAAGAMGMEYPTLITGGVRWPSPPESMSPEEVTVHEFGHQFWYGLVGSNEFEEAWLDEGLTTFSTGLVIDKVYGPATLSPRLLGVPMTPFLAGATYSQRDRAMAAQMIAPDEDAIAQPAWSYRSSWSYGMNSYMRPQLALHELGAEIGEDTLLKGLRAYQQRWRYRHPSSDDLQQTLEEVSGRSLKIFFEDVIHGIEALDYAVESLSSKRKKIFQEGVFEPVGDGHRIVSSTTAAALNERVPEDERLYVNEVVVARRAGRIVPVTVEIEMSDGPPYRGRWDGRHRWHRIRFESKERAVSARVYADVDRPLDIRPSNDTRTREPNPAVGRTWTARALFWLQSVLQLGGGIL